jgi:cytochrome c peroxidase
VILALFLVVVFASVNAQVPAPHPIPTLEPLTGIRPPEPPNLGDFVTTTPDGRAALLILGKALFWEMGAGSDVQACASCHFAAGADSRSKNQLDPDLRNVDPAVGAIFNPTRTGAQGGPNYQLRAGDFPFHVLADPLNRDSAVIFDTDDITSSQGVFEFLFGGIQNPRANNSVEVFTDIEGLRIFTVGDFPGDFVNDVHTRKVEPRNTPTSINAALNFRNFWDGRANNVFNGVSPFGPRDKDAVVYQSHWNGSFNEAVPIHIAIPNSSAASQAVGPPLSDFEMSSAQREFPDIALKLLGRKVLQLQAVDPTDSVLGPYADTVTGKGLVCTTRSVGPAALQCKMKLDPLTGQMVPAVTAITYRQLIQLAFHSEFWNFGFLPTGYRQIEQNFSLFWGLAIQAYESTLISDQTRLDDFLNGNAAALSDQEKLGMDVFTGKGLCIACHKGPDLSGAGFRLLAEAQENGLVERMIMGDDKVAIYDNGFYNIGVVPTVNDLGVGATDPFKNPLSFAREFQKMIAGIDVPDKFQVDPCTFEADPCIPVTDPNHREAVDGAFKVPGLRNVALTAPYFHNGGYATLESVVEFYNRGGNRRIVQPNGDTTGLNQNPSNLDVDIRPLGLTVDERAALVAFLKALTDERVRFERAPFDHPSLNVPNGHPVDANGKPILKVGTSRAVDTFIKIPAVGAAGLATPIQTFTPVP